MWLNWECGGVLCGSLTYFVVVTVQIGLLRIGLWEPLLNGEIWAYLNLLVFQYHCGMIFWSHFKCMTTEPGVLPKDYEELDYSKMAP